MFQLLAGLLAFFYELIPNYAAAISLLTVAVMFVLFPLMLKSTRSMLQMQQLQPELKRLQQELKGDRQKLTEAQMALYKEKGINPLAGCLPMILQMPVFIVMYRVIAGMSHVSNGVAMPRYLDSDTELYQALVRDGGRMNSLGMDLAKAASNDHATFVAALPFFVLVALVIVTQYVQTRQMTARSAASAQTPQTQMMMRIMPLFFGVISFSIPAGVNVYFLVSALFRIVQQEAMYRFDPALAHHARTVKEEKLKAGPIETKAKDVPKNGKRPGGGGGGGGGGKSGGGKGGKQGQARRNRRGR